MQDNAMLMTISEWGIVGVQFIRYSTVVFSVRGHFGLKLPTFVSEQKNEKLAKKLCCELCMLAERG